MSRAFFSKEVKEAVTLGTGRKLRHWRLMMRGLKAAVVDRGSRTGRESVRFIAPDLMA